MATTTAAALLAPAGRKHGRGSPRDRFGDGRGEHALEHEVDGGRGVLHIDEPTLIASVVVKRLVTSLTISGVYDCVWSV